MHITLPNPNNVENIKYTIREAIMCSFDYEGNNYILAFKYFGYKQGSRIGQTVKTPSAISELSDVNLSSHLFGFYVNNKPCHEFYAGYSGIKNLQDWFDYIHLSCFGLYGHPLQLYLLGKGSQTTFRKGSQNRF